MESVALIPSERTRIALAEIDPLARVVLVSAVPEFVVTFRRAIERFASHVTAVSTGVLDGMHADIRAFEYQHVPDPVKVETVLLPLIERIRTELHENSAPRRTHEGTRFKLDAD